MAPDRNPTVPTFGTPSWPQNGLKRRYSQVDGIDKDSTPGIIKTPPLNPDSPESGPRHAFDAYSIDSRSAAFQDHGQGGLRESSDEVGEHEAPTPGEIEIIEISDEEDSNESDSDEQHKNPKVTTTYVGPGAIPVAVYPDKRVPAAKTRRAGARRIESTATTQPMANKNSRAEAGAKPGCNENLPAKGEYKLSLWKLASQIPPNLLGRNDAGTKYRIWIGALRYVDQLHGTTMERMITQKEPRGNLHTVLMKRALFEYVKDRCAFETIGGTFYDDSKNSGLLARALAAYFEQHKQKSGGPGLTEVARDTGEGNSKSKDTPVANGATTTRPSTAIASPTHIDSTHQEGASHYIRELPVSGPSLRIPRALLEQGPQEYFIRDLPVEKAATGTTDATEPITGADNNLELERMQVEVGLLLDSDQRPTTAPSSIKREPVSEPEASTNSGEMTERDAITDPDMIGSGRLEATTGVATGSEVVEKSVKALQTAVRKSLKKNVDWNNVPVALFECEMALKRVQTALDKAKEAFAKHGDQVEAD